MRIILLFVGILLSISIAANKYRYNGWSYIKETDNIDGQSIKFDTVLNIFIWNDSNMIIKSIKPIVESFVKMRNSKVEKRLYSLYYQIESNKTWFYVRPISGSFSDFDNVKQNIIGALRYHNEADSQQTYFIIADLDKNSDYFDYFIATDDSVEVYNKSIIINDGSLFIIDDRIFEFFWGYIEDDKITPVHFSYDRQDFIYYEPQNGESIICQDFTPFFDSLGLKLSDNSILQIKDFKSSNN